MKQFTHEMRVPTRGKGLYEITREIESWVARQGIATGLLTALVRHTSASLVIQENADPDVMRDLNDFFERLAPEADPHYRHTAEGDDDMPAHIKAALTQVQLSIPVVASALALGTWQGIYLFEHRSHPHTRAVVLHLLGE
ncbi:MAG TPA: secondary thiamine-phosphate synthase enzyme YjbQ [Bryobacteraceae bacterium]|nr:secondary thiamine-phosphate synthase enzyme YjbQ [Bryobacteraceae bacterium]